jgi:hypothetical protein
LPVRMTFAIGKPLPPPSADAPHEELGRFRDRVARKVHHLLTRASDA